MDLIFATHNKGKLKEVQGIVPQGIKVISLDDLGVQDDIEETGATLEENALIKARFLHKKYQQPVLADDTGLEVQALNGAPGVYSARYAGVHGDAENNMNLLLRNMEGLSERSAQFRTVMAYIDASGQEKLFEGLVQGSILEERQGAEGFGYDPIFQPQGFSLSFAQMSLAEKNVISHRARALMLFMEFIKQEVQ
jgi:XTP/dITP diphosphohydrolase